MNFDIKEKQEINYKKLWYDLKNYLMYGFYNDNKYHLENPDIDFMNSVNINFLKFMDTMEFNLNEKEKESYHHYLMKLHEASKELEKIKSKYKLGY